MTPIDITIPAPGASPSASADRPTQTDPKARALVEKFVDAVGGATKLAGVKALHQVVSATQQTPQGPMNLTNDTTIQFPDKLRAAVTSEQLPGQMLIVVTPSTAFMSMPGAGTRDMPSSLKQSRLNSLKRDWLPLAQHAADPAYVFTLGGTQRVGDADAQVVNIFGGGVSVKWALDPQSGRLLRASYDDVGQRGPVQRAIDYSDWRPVEGLTVPFKRSGTENGEPSTSEEIQKYEINPPIDDKLFEKPPDAPPPAK